MIPGATLRRHKFHAVKTECANCEKPHPSKAEAKRCDHLHTLQELGELARLEMQPKFVCQVDGKKVCTYIADFSYWTDAGRTVEDVKGHLTPVYRLKKKLVEALFPGTKITEVR